MHMIGTQLALVCLNCLNCAGLANCMTVIVQVCLVALLFKEMQAPEGCCYATKAGQCS